MATARTETSPSPLIEDWEAIAALDQVGRQTGRDLVHEVLERYLDQGTRKLDEMRDALVRRDSATLAQAAHFMAGSSAVLRIRILASGFRELEASASKNELDVCTAELARLEEAFGELADDLLRWLGRAEKHSL